MRCSDVKRVTPRAYRLWLEVGLLGYDTSGQPGRRGRAGTMAGTRRSRTYCPAAGLRLREGGCLFTVEVPEAAAGHCYYEGSVAGAVARRRESVLYASAAALRRAAGYMPHHEG